MFVFRWYNADWYVTMVYNVITNTSKKRTSNCPQTTTSQNNQFGLLFFTIFANKLSRFSTFLHKLKLNLQK